MRAGPAFGAAATWELGSTAVAANPAWAGPVVTGGGAGHRTGYIRNAGDVLAPTPAAGAALVAADVGLAACQAAAVPPAAVGGAGAPPVAAAAFHLRWTEHV